MGSGGWLCLCLAVSSARSPCRISREAARLFGDHTLFREVFERVSVSLSPLTNCLFFTPVPIAASAEAEQVHGLQAEHHRVAAVDQLPMATGCHKYFR